MGRGDDGLIKKEGQKIGTCTHLGEKFSLLMAILHPA